MQQGNDSDVPAEAIVIDVQYRHVEATMCSRLKT